MPRLSLALAAALLLAACSPHGPSSAGAPDAEVELLPDPEAGAPITWDGWAGGFVRDYCVQCHNPAASCGGEDCHPANGPLPDFRLHATVVGYGPMIRCGVAVQPDPSWAGCSGIGIEQFPVNDGNNPMPTDAQRGYLVEWIDAGSP